MAAKRAAQQLSVGIVVLFSIAVFAGVVLVLGENSQLFARSNDYTTLFVDASGLREGSPVTMAGVRIGSIGRIVLPTDPDSEGIEISMRIDRSYAERIREGTEASAVFLQIVANEKSVDLTPGDPERPVLPPGASIPPAASDPIFETGRSIADTLETITKDLEEILAAISSGEGLLGRAIVDPEFGSQLLGELDESMTSLSQVLARIESGEGLAGKLIADQEYGDTVADDLSGAIAGMSKIVDELQAGEGLLGQLLSGDSESTLAADLEAGADAVRSVAESIEGGEGLVGVLLKDEELARRVGSNLDELTARLASIARKIDDGEGTLGLMVNDRTLHDDVQQLIAGVRSSKVASWLIRRYYARGAGEEVASGS